MVRNRIDELEYRRIAEEVGVSPDTVRSVVNSFFDTILCDARSLPFNNYRKIFTKEKFSEYSVVRNIPSLGRIGPVYSRYLKWRANESQCLTQVPRSSYQSRFSQSEVENMAAEILSGGTPSPVNKKKNSELYERVWLVGQGGKKSARQVIPKEDKDGI